METRCVLLCTAAYLASLTGNTDNGLSLIDVPSLGILRLLSFGPKYPLSRLSMSASHNTQQRYLHHPEDKTPNFLPGYVRLIFPKREVI